MSFSDEEIIAFLLGDADEDLAVRIRANLPKDPELAERLSHFRSVLNHLDYVGDQQYEPPSDLIQRTMDKIEELPAESTSIAQRDGEDCASEMDPLDRPVVSFLSTPVESNRSRRTWLDSMALTVSLVVLCSLTIPAIVRARYESRRAQCATNLRDTGSLLFQYAMRQPSRRFPFVSSSGPEAFSGMYVVRLSESGLVPSSRMLRCASLNGVNRPLPKVIAIPTVEQLHTATPSQLDCWKCNVGGDYAYNLGVFEDEQLVAPKNVGSSHFAILADAPVFLNDCEELLAHDGKGINILYDDGQVRFLRSSCFASQELTLDNPFRNFHGAHEAGIGIRDASLAPSQFPPIAH